MCVNALGGRLSEAVVCLQAIVYVGVGAPLLLMTFDLCYAPPTLTRTPNPSHEHEDPGAIAGSVQLEDSL